MSYKTTQRPVQQAKQRPLRDEEKQARIIQFLQQKREQFAVSILCNMIQGEIDNLICNSDAPSAIVKMSIKMADQLLEMLYPINDEVHKAAEE